MKIGYARVSTEGQSLDAQTDALEAAGCRRLYSDIRSGAADERDGLSRALDSLREGDTLVVTRLDRLGRSMKHLVETVNDLEDTGVGFQSLSEGIDTTTNGGRLVFHIFGALAEFERNLIRERTTAGLKAARARGRMGGRPRLLTKRKLDIAKKALADGTQSVGDVAETLGVSRSTLYRGLKRES